MSPPIEYFSAESFSCFYLWLTPIVRHDPIRMIHSKNNACILLLSLNGCFFARHGFHLTVCFASLFVDRIINAGESEGMMVRGLLVLFFAPTNPIDFLFSSLDFLH
jgi:hypothetical protein